MGFLNTYVLIIGSLILTTLTGILIWWLLKKIKEDKCDTVDPTGKTTYFAARGGLCNIDVNNLWWQNQEWKPWYFPSPNGTIDWNATGTMISNPTCTKYNGGDMERICTTDPKCKGWSQGGELGKGSDACYFYKDDVKFIDKDKGALHIPKYSCTPSPAYPSIGGIQNTYLINQHLNPIKSPGLG